MQTQDGSDIQFDLTVPPLAHYFGGSSTDMFATNPFFGHATIDPNATLAPPSSPALTVAGSAAAGGGGVSPLSTMSGLMPSQDGSDQTLNNDRGRISSFSFAGMDKLFYNGTPSSGDASSLYIQIPQSENEGGVSCGSEFWVSVAWDKVVPKLIDFPDVLKDVMKYISERPDLKDKAIQMMGGVPNLSRANDGGLRSDGTMSTTGSSSSLSVPVSATFSSNSSRDSTLSSFSDSINTSSSGAISPSSIPRPRANSGYLQSPLGSARAGSFSAGVNSTLGSSSKPWNFASRQIADMSLKLPAMPAPDPGVDDLIKHHLSRAGPPSATFQSVDFGTSIVENLSSESGITVLTARVDTIDPFLLAQPDVTHNEHTLEYVWSRSDSTLYKAESLQGQQALTEAGSVHFIFPPRTMLLAYEKDGTIATPAYSNLHPHSNEWLKAQVCHRSCPYRAGTASLKRPKTVREHFRKCVYLDEKHPLKILSALQLAVLEREASGALPNRRRAKMIRMATESANELY